MAIRQTPATKGSPTRAGPGPGTSGMDKAFTVSKFVCDLAPSVAVQIVGFDARVPWPSEGDYADLVKRMFAFCGTTFWTRSTRSASAW